MSVGAEGVVPETAAGVNKAAPFALRTSFTMATIRAVTPTAPAIAPTAAPAFAPVERPVLADCVLFEHSESTIAVEVQKAA